VSKDADEKLLSFSAKMAPRVSFSINEKLKSGIGGKHDRHSLQKGHKIFKQRQSRGINISCRCVEREGFWVGRCC
jgi:hypothetical protein